MATSFGSATPQGQGQGQGSCWRVRACYTLHFTEHAKWLWLQQGDGMRGGRSGGWSG